MNIARIYIGASTRDASVLSLTDGTAITRCESVTGMGGGMLVGGESLTITAIHNSKPVVIQRNRAKKGGGVSFMGRVKLDGDGSTRILGNSATESGGGIYGFSSFARLDSDPDHRLIVEDNEARQDGGGIFLAKGAQFSFSFPACDSKCTSSMRGNGKCDYGCMSVGCNFDDGECNSGQNSQKSVLNDFIEYIYQGSDF